MKITDILVKEMSFRRRKVFKIAFTQSMYARGVYVKVFTDGGLAGMGEAVPMPFVTGETIGGVMAAIEHMKPALLGAEVEDIAAVHAIMDSQIAGNTAAKAAIDMACYDLMGKKAGMPVHRLLGAATDTLQTDVTIGIDTADNHYAFFEDEACTVPYSYEAEVVTEDTVIYARENAFDTNSTSN